MGVKKNQKHSEQECVLGPRRGQGFGMPADKLVNRLGLESPAGSKVGASALTRRRSNIKHRWVGDGDDDDHAAFSTQRPVHVNFWARRSGEVG